MRIRWTTCQLALIALLVLGGSAAAETDPPGRVGRISFISGTVSLLTPGEQNWSPAPLNVPVTTGMSVWTEPDSRTEIQIGGDEIRLDGGTLVTVTRLDDDATEVAVQQGVVNVHMRVLPPGGVIVTTPLGDVDLARAGTYHIDAGRPNGQAPSEHVEIAALEGEAQFRGERTTIQIMAGENARIGGNPMTMSIVEANATPFDDWALARERREVASETERYVSPETTGYTDLDSYGHWAGGGADYGHVWFPDSVPVGWAPYRFGHWAFIPPWGWTWVDDAPWGFAPFHYGRWVFLDGRWGWWPGATIIARPVFAPALVAFFGGPSFGVVVASGRPFGAIGWVPLAPHEVFHPWFHASAIFVRNVNVVVVNRTVLDNIHSGRPSTVSVVQFANRRVATVIPSDAFVHAARVDRTTVVLPREELDRTHVVGELGHLRPTALSRAGVAGPGSSVAIGAVPNPPGQIAVLPAPRTIPGNRPPAGPNLGTGGLTAPRSPGPPIRDVRRPSPGALNEPGHGVGATGGSVVVRRGTPGPQPSTGVNHPTQTTRITPTPHGWVRQAPGGHEGGRGGSGEGGRSGPSGGRGGSATPSTGGPGGGPSGGGPGGGGAGGGGFGRGGR
jgi:hypothetical protein